MNKYLLYTLSILKTVWINFRYLPISQAKKIPLLVAFDTSFCCHSGKVIFETPIRRGMIRIGFHEVPACNRLKTKIEIQGSLIFRGEAHIGNGSKIYVSKNACLILGDDFKISANTSILCYHKIEFGYNIQFNWECLVMDSDTHTILDENSYCCNSDKPVFFGNNIWIGCRSTILKGSILPNNCIVGSMSLISGNKFEPNTIIVGCPAKSVKRISGWKL